MRVIPRAGRTAIAGMREGSLLVRVAAAPVDHAANDALIELLSDTFHLPRRSFTITSGHTSRNKRIAIEGLDDAQVAARLSDMLRHS